MSGHERSVLVDSAQETEDAEGESRGGITAALDERAVEQEGKSTAAANLALAEAHSGCRVALVDLDLGQPYVDRPFGLRHAHGITDVALGEADLGSALHRIDLATGAAGFGRPCGAGWRRARRAGLTRRAHGRAAAAGSR